jgi:hypothetical protein
MNVAYVGCARVCRLTQSMSSSGPLAGYAAMQTHTDTLYNMIVLLCPSSFLSKPPPKSLASQSCRDGHRSVHKCPLLRTIADLLSIYSAN